MSFALPWGSIPLQAELESDVASACMHCHWEVPADDLADWCHPGYSSATSTQCHSPQDSLFCEKTTHRYTGCLDFASCR